MKIWKELLIDLDFKYFRQAVVDICKTRVDIYPGTNIPALIRSHAKDIRLKELKDENQKKMDEQFNRYKLEAMKPEEAQKFLEKSGFHMKQVPKVAG